jgi:hypothetical protein
MTQHAASRRGGTLLATSAEPVWLASSHKAVAELPHAQSVASSVKAFQQTLRENVPQGQQKTWRSAVQSSGRMYSRTDVGAPVPHVQFGRVAKRTLHLLDGGCTKLRWWMFLLTTSHTQLRWRVHTRFGTHSPLALATVALQRVPLTPPLPGLAERSAAAGRTGPHHAHHHLSGEVHVGGPGEHPALSADAAGHCTAIRHQCPHIHHMAAHHDQRAHAGGYPPPPVVRGPRRRDDRWLRHGRLRRRATRATRQRILVRRLPCRKPKILELVPRWLADGEVR